MKKRGNFDGDDVTEGDNACRSADLLLKEIGAALAVLPKRIAGVAREYDIRSLPQYQATIDSLNNLRREVRNGIDEQYKQLDWEKYD